MIKTLLNADEEAKKKAAPVSEDKIVETPPSEETPSIKEPETEIAVPPVVENPPPKINETPFEVFEIPEDAKFFSKSEDVQDEPEPDFSQMSEDDLEKLLQDEDENYKTLTAEPFAAEVPQEKPGIVSPENESIFMGESEPSWGETESESSKTEAETTITTPYDYKPETPDETIRKTGLAYSAAMVLLAAVVFMMILGWFADLLLGSSPWGIVGGIILGAIIGFVQFFRIASSIFKQ